MLSQQFHSLPLVDCFFSTTTTDHQQDTHTPTPLQGSNKSGEERRHQKKGLFKRQLSRGKKRQTFFSFSGRCGVGGGYGARQGRQCSTWRATTSSPSPASRRDGRQRLPATVAAASHAAPRAGRHHLSRPPPPWHPACARSGMIRKFRTTVWYEQMIPRVERSA